MSLADLHPGISVFFSVTVDTVPLGTWNKLSGLGMSIQHADRTDTAMSMFYNHLPGAMTYSPITLERLIGPETAQTLNWFSAYHMLPIPVTGQIVCLTQDMEPVMSWELLGVSPREWRGPTLDAGSAAALTETLTINHMGFL
ncbi:MAG TPA: phage tail protein [Acidimicrobiales bacterium]|jgi:phage tail-like protein|nr:phage tail protein [Acidimicrobiales bacterium]